MVLAVRRTAPVAAVVCCALAWPAAVPAQEGPAVPGGGPTLTDEPPVPLDGPDPTPTPTPEPTATAEPTTTPDPPTAEATGGPGLPATGAEAWVLAATGLGLLAAGTGLRLRLAADDGRRG